MRAGFTLIEMMVALAIGLFLVAAVLTFVSHQGTLLEYTKTELERDRGGRLAMDMLEQDIRHAGVGVGYTNEGAFAGFMRGDNIALADGVFAVPGGADFDATDRAIALEYGQNQQGLSGTYDVFTDDLGLRMANGDYRTIVEFGASTGRLCSGGSFAIDDIVLLSADDGFTSASARVTAFAANTGCPADVTCASGCDQFDYVFDGGWASDAAATTASYLGGEMRGGFQQVVWFVEPDGATAHLRRAEVSNTAQCTTRAGCGNIVAYDAEALQVRVWRWNIDTGGWTDRTDDPSIDDRQRLRIDVELVVRTRTSESSPKEPARMRLINGTTTDTDDMCLPGGTALPCTEKDYISRRVLRSSIEVRNSGRMQYEVVAR
jgi:prepilin-type N-terminal cleavage/methylation domain-containing protein